MRKSSVKNETVPADSNELTKRSVKIKLPQGYKQSIHFRVLEGTVLNTTVLSPGCFPRNGAERQNKDMLELPASVINNFPAINHKLMAWLEQSPGNVKRFLNKPVEALLEAGIDLTRAELKQLAGNIKLIKDVRLIPPGVAVKQVTASVGKGKKL